MTCHISKWSTEFLIERYDSQKDKELIDQIDLELTNIRENLKSQYAESHSLNKELENIYDHDLDINMLSANTKKYISRIANEGFYKFAEIYHPNDYHKMNFQINYRSTETRQGTGLMIHNHPIIDAVGVFYYRSDPNSVPLTCFEPKMSSIGAFTHSKNFNIYPEEGMVVFMPAYVWHGTSVQKDMTIRKTIVMDCTVTNKEVLETSIIKIDQKN